MAWIRTSTSLISFGFTIYKFFEYLVQANNTSLSHNLFGPREFALCMIGVGIIALAIAAIEYRHTLKLLEEEHGTTYESLAEKLAVLIFLIGLGLLIVVLLQR
jgi:putative membrane protein